MSNSWFERLLSSIVERGKAWIRIPANLPNFERACELARLLISERGEASGAALASSLVAAYDALDTDERVQFLTYIANAFAPDEVALKLAAETYLAKPGPAAASALSQASEPPRQELLRRLNMATKGTETLVAMRRETLRNVGANEQLLPLERDLRHLLASWFNRGFLELRRIDWHTSASVLEKLILYEAVHEIRGWEDLRRRLADDRRCFAFFHPALPDEPLIFVEVALVNGLASAIEPLLRQQVQQPDKAPDTAVFYSISNCQAGLRSISFGNFLIKQVVEVLRSDMLSLERFATLSPAPAFRAWLDRRLADDTSVNTELAAALTAFTANPAAATGDNRLQQQLKQLCAEFLTTNIESRGPEDSVARFHLGNGARLQRINPLGNINPKGLQESYGVMVNYLYDPRHIESNHEQFVRSGEIAVSSEIKSLQRIEDTAARQVGALLGFGSRQR